MQLDKSKGEGAKSRRKKWSKVSRKVCGPDCSIPLSVYVGQKRCCDVDSNVTQPMDIDDLGIVKKKHKSSDDLDQSSSFYSEVAGPTRALSDQ